ncbi:prolyl oligopeptidase family serine peptidase [Bacillus mangrovi]|uniref:Prolyl oligopeptidase family serine peptidase n=1 Tax=Metabacillus mangrovi TaxID=1491830 RepID=A0A7X2S5Y9_9BACI|nr:S9 family peptidase [Metabacillus mangrovi]MTH53860.1 prolyl oligopeptidase family serine peptidase [Metabacillus mangrovi]
MKKQNIQAEDLYRMKFVADPLMAPDGQGAVYTETTINTQTNKYETHLFYLHRETGRQCRLTEGKSKNHSPAWSPDGRLAFLSDRTGILQVYVMTVPDGEAKQVTFSGQGVSQPVWNGNDELIFLSYLREDAALEDAEKAEAVPLAATELHYKSDRTGLIKDRKNRVFALRLSSRKVRELWQGSADAEDPAQSGSSLAFVHYPSPSIEEGFVSEIRIADLQSREIRKVTTGKGVYSKPQFSPDGRFLAFLGHEKEFEGATLQKLWLYDLQLETLQCLTRDWDMHAADAAVSDSVFGSVYRGIQWTADSQGFYLLASDRGSTGLYYGSIEGLMYPVRLEAEHINGLSLHPEEHIALLTISSPEAPSELFELNVLTGELNQLTFSNSSWLQQTVRSIPEPFEAEAEDGWVIHGWIMKPAGAGEDGKVPLILQIHGGPHMMYSHTYMHEFQMLASMGYAVLYMNPRGSQGYGQDFANLVRGDYGGSDCKDLLTALDAAIERFDFVDTERIGVAGGSYGGFMTSWMLGHTNRFKAAVTQRSISNWISFYGTSDIGPSFTSTELGGTMPEDAEMLWDRSPLKYAGEIRTPLLILHSEKDYRCPMEQAEQLYTVMKAQNKTVKLLRFPEQNHEMSRSGNPLLRVKRLEAIAGWFERNL